MTKTHVVTSGTMTAELSLTKFGARLIVKEDGFQNPVADLGNINQKGSLRVIRDLLNAHLEEKCE